MIEPKISVVIPTYNREDCIRDAIDSVLSQTFSDYEIIVVDDGSTDDTRHIFDSYKQRVRYIYQENSGVSAARNRGIREAKGEWVAFLDSDDEWLPTKLAEQMDCLMKYPDVVALACNAEIVMGDQSCNLFELRGFRNTSGSYSKLIKPLISVLEANFTTQALIIERVVLDKAGLFDEKLSLYEDIDLLARVALEGAWGVTDEPLVKVLRKTDENLSSQHVKDPTRSPRNMIHIYEKLLQSTGMTDEEKRYVRKRLSDQYFQLGFALMKMRVSESYFQYLYSAMKENVTLKNVAKVVLLLVLRPDLYGSFVRNSFRTNDAFRRSEK